MTRRLLAASGVVATGVVLALSPSAALADTQPADLGNVANVGRGASAQGPHCHFVLPASGAGPFDMIITGAAHQGHTQTGVPTGIFQATTCP